MQPDLVVVLPPGANDLSGLQAGFKPVLVEVFVPELAVEALDVAVLHRPAVELGCGGCHGSGPNP